MAKLSIITINLNNIWGIRKTSKSVSDQTFCDYEFLIIDGGSTDGSLNVFSELSVQPNLIISEKDSGMYDAMNKGIEAANGDYLMFLNSGDYLLQENVLSECFQKIKTVHADIYYGDIEIEDSNGNQRIRYTEKPSLAYWQNGNINHQAAFYKRELFDELGYYDLQFQLAADNAFNLKAFAHGKKFHHLGIPIVYYDVNGQSSKNFQIYKAEMQKAYEYLLPTEVRRIISEHDKYNRLLQQRIIKKAVVINKAYQNFRQWLKNKRGNTDIK